MSAKTKIKQLIVDIARTELIQTGHAGRVNNQILEAGIDVKRCQLRLKADKAGKLSAIEIIIDTAKYEVVVLTQPDKDSMAVVTGWTAQDWELSTLKLTPDNQLEMGSDVWYIVTEQLTTKQVNAFKAMTDG